jgi:hypothetical protein
MSRASFPVVLLCSSLLLPACGGSDEEPGPENDIVFAEASASERQAVARAAIGERSFEAMALLMSAEASSFMTLTCPTRTENGTTVTLEADGCTGANGAIYRGRIVAVNAPSLFSPTVPTGPMSIEFDDFHMEKAPFDTDLTAVHGTITRSEQAEGLPYEAGVDATFVGAETVSLAMTMHCVPDGAITSCHIASSEAAGVVEGVGRFLVTGDLVMAGHTSGSVALVGEDVLALDLDGAAGGCAPATIQEVATDRICLGTIAP